MDFRIGYRRPLRSAALLRKKRLRVRILSGVLVAVSVLALAARWPVTVPAPAPLAVAPGKAAPIMQLALNSKGTGEASAARRIYPYSIVPGGVASRADLERRVATDKVVARHYASFDIKKAHAVTVKTPRAVHVSYRKGDKVYWTKNKIMLAQGETLLSDGTSAMRGRCGNRISDTAMLPVALGEPTAAELDESMQVAPDPLEDGGLENASFLFGDDLPSGNATASRSFPGFAQSNPAPAEPYRRGSMPAAPMGAPNGMGLLPSRYLSVAAAPTIALGPVTEGAITIPPAAFETPVSPLTPVSPVSPSTPASPASPVSPVSINPSAPPDASAPPASTIPPVSITPPVDGAPSMGGTPPLLTPPPGVPTPAAPPVTALPPTEIPEPGTLPLTGVALALMLAVMRTRGRKTS